MKKLFSTLMVLVVFASPLLAQINPANYPLVPIDSIQFVTPNDLGAGIDLSYMDGDTVRIQGIVAVPPGLTNIGSTDGRQIVLQKDTGAFGAIEVIQFGGPTTPEDILNLAAGDEVLIVGVVDDYSNHTQINPVLFCSPAISTNNPVRFKKLEAGVLNDNQTVAQNITGEQWESMPSDFGEHTISSTQPISGGARVKFTVEDDFGNKLPVFDRFAQQFQLPVTLGSELCFQFGQTGDTLCEGDIVKSIKGVVSHFNDEYNLYPFDSTHYELQVSGAPRITSIERSPLQPSSSDAVTISVLAQDLGGSGLQKVELFYHVGDDKVAATSYNVVQMQYVFGYYQATIPAQNNMNVVKYFVKVTDNQGKERSNPNVYKNRNPLFYRVNDEGLTIQQIQYVPASFSSGFSSFEDQTVTFDARIASSGSLDNLGVVFGIQPGKTSWGGVWLTGSADLNNLNIGDDVTVTGRVEENFGMTRINVTSVTFKSSGNTVTPIALNPSVLSEYDVTTAEPYESMFVSLEASQANVMVVDTNPDGTRNYADFRIGTDIFDPNNGTRVMTGRVSGSAFSSLNVSYINNIRWATQDGALNVTPTVINTGDQFSSVKGIVFYGFGEIRVLPRVTADFTPVTTSIDDNVAQVSQVNVFPNPANSTININVADAQNGAVNLQMFDVAGRLVKQTELNATINTLNISNIEAGVYLLRLTNNSGQQLYNQKVVVDR